jgi:hypothetical protein
MKKTKIIPQPAFANGKRFMAHYMSMISCFDDLFNHVIFRYTLYDENGVHAGESTFELTGEGYAAWDTTPEHAYLLCLAAISLEHQPKLAQTSEEGNNDKTYSMFEDQ